MQDNSVIQDVALSRTNSVGGSQMLPESANCVVISLNPKAGARSGLPIVERLAALLRAKNYQTEIIRDIDSVAQRAALLSQEGRLRAVVAAGGDGTVGLVANRTPQGTPIMVLPLGTENLLSKFLRITNNPQSACKIIERGATLPVDAGTANGRLFVLMLSCGWDAEVVRRVAEVRRGHIRHLTYAKPILASLRNYKYPEMRVAYWEGEESFQHSARWVFVQNLPCYAMGLNFAPQASGVDGALDICTFRAGSLWHGMRYLGAVVFGRHHTWKDCKIFRATRLRIEADQPIPYQLDGDHVGFLPVEVAIIPRRVTLVVPETWAKWISGVNT